jgi:hypothetical protein
MRIAAVLGVRDEVELIRPAIAHLRAIGVDHVIATDGGSTDGTAEVLAEAAQGEGFEVMPSADIGYDAAEPEMRSAARALDRARRAGADWVLFCDADEFWLPATGRLRDVRALAGAEALTVARFNVPLVAGGGAPPFPLAPDRYRDLLLYAPEEGRRATQARVRRDAEAPWIAAVPADKVMVRPDAAAATGAGHHSAVGAEGRRIAATRPRDLVIAHLPFTTEARFARKVANIAALVAASGHRWAPGSAWHWRRWLEAAGREGGVAREVARNTVTAAEAAELRRAGVVRSAAELLGGRP